MSESNDEVRPVAFNTAEIGALAHLYRGELYRSTVWRTRLDNPESLLCRKIRGSGSATGHVGNTLDRARW
jgi:hypothetical protein